MNWYTTRSVYHFGIRENGNNVFEERIVCFEATDLDELNEKAEKESVEYATDNGFEAHDEQLTYRHACKLLGGGKPLVDRYELWSALYESDKSLNDFYEDHYNKYFYDADLEEGVFDISTDFSKAK